LHRRQATSRNYSDRSSRNTYAKHREAIGDGFKIRISTHANDRQEIDFAPIAGNNISSFHVQGERRGNRLISLMVRCRYRT
jgi:hypothetical protein